jgi:hypothetical protein
MKSTSNKTSKSAKKTKMAKTTKKNNLAKAQKKLDEFIELLKSSKDEMSESLKNDLEYLIKMCSLSGKIPDVGKKKSQTKKERLAKLKEVEKEMAIQDVPNCKYDEKHVKRLLRLLDIDKKTAKEISEVEKFKHNLHVPYVENSLDKTMAVELDICNSCTSSINLLRESAEIPFNMKKAIKSIDKGLKEIKKSNPKIVDKWKITSNTIKGSEYIYVDVDYKTTLNTHRHIFKLGPTHFVETFHFFDDTKTETLGDKPKTKIVDKKA